MEKISQEEFQKLLSSGKVLEEDSFGIKVVETDDNRIIKTFRLKRLFSSAFFYPYALRFKNNSEKLLEKGFKTVSVEQLSYCRAAKRHVLIYPKLAGETLRDVFKAEPKNTQKQLTDLARLIAKLHKEGVLFRSLHLGNVLILPDQTLGLIDLSDMKIFSSPLSLQQRIRNFNHLLRYPQDCKIIVQFGIVRFLTAYCEAANLSTDQQKKLFLEFK
jgi:tRNA A-37 threonylcarbamoyl transferase component Bud32